MEKISSIAHITNHIKIFSSPLVYYFYEGSFSIDRLKHLLSFSTSKFLKVRGRNSMSIFLFQVSNTKGRIGSAKRCLGRIEQEKHENKRRACRPQGKGEGSEGGRWKVLQGSSKKKISAGDEGMFWAKVAY